MFVCMLAVKMISLLAFTAAKQGLVYAKGYGGYVGVRCSIVLPLPLIVKVPKFLKLYWW